MARLALEPGETIVYTGEDVLFRIVFSACLGAAVAGCANDRPSSFELSSASTLSVAPVTTSAVSPKSNATTTAEISPAALPRKTITDRVLTAIALERVTGLKPDPSRFVQ